MLYNSEKKMPIHKTHFLENNRRVDIFDDVFPLHWRSHAYSFCSKSAFRLGWEDTNVPEHQTHGKLLHSVYSNQDITNLQIFDHVNDTEIPSYISGLTLKKSVLNLSVPSDVNYIHNHAEKKVLLYYVNVEWHEGWHGETLFYSENLKDIQLGLPYTPGRLVIFDGSIPHTIRPQSIIACHHRMTLSMFYN